MSCFGHPQAEAEGQGADSQREQGAPAVFGVPCCLFVGPSPGLCIVTVCQLFEQCYSRMFAAIFSYVWLRHTTSAHTICTGSSRGYCVMSICSGPFLTRVHVLSVPHMHAAACRRVARAVGEAGGKHTQPTTASGALRCGLAAAAATAA